MSEMLEGTLSHYRIVGLLGDGGKACVAAMRRAYAASGRTGYWRATLDFWRAHQRGAPGSEVGAAMLYTQLGDFDRAVEHLERAYAMRSGDLLFVGVEPLFDPLRNEPRFEAIMRRVDAESGGVR